MVNNNFKTILDDEKSKMVKDDKKPLKESKTIFVVSATRLNYDGLKSKK